MTKNGQKLRKISKKLYKSYGLAQGSNPRPRGSQSSLFTFKAEKYKNAETIEFSSALPESNSYQKRVNFCRIVVQNLTSVEISVTVRISQKQRKVNKSSPIALKYCIPSSPSCCLSQNLDSRALTFNRDKFFPCSSTKGISKDISPASIRIINKSVTIEANVILNFNL